MSRIQKVIKYLAISFAICLIVSIISSIMYGIISLTNVFSKSDNVTNLNEVKINNDISSLDIDLSNVNVMIKKGNKFKIETNSDNINYRVVENNLFINQKDDNWFNRKVNSDLIIYVEKNFVFDFVLIENGAGKLDINDLSTNELELDLGAGKVTIDKLTVLKEASIDGGAGEVNISNSSINNLDLDMGIGKVLISSTLTGNSEIDAGIGEVDLNLLDKEDNYKINIDKSIGEIIIDGNKVGEENSYGNGLNTIDISGGIGSININFK